MSEAGVLLAMPAEKRQVGGEASRYDRELRGALMIGAIEQLQRADVEPDIWKIEGLDSAQDCELVAEIDAYTGAK